jgi:hypothetical protein
MSCPSACRQASTIEYGIQQRARATDTLAANPSVASQPSPLFLPALYQVVQCCAIAPFLFLPVTLSSLVDKVDIHYYFQYVTCSLSGKFVKSFCTNNCVFPPW